MVRLSIQTPSGPHESGSVIRVPRQTSHARASGRDADGATRSPPDTRWVTPSRTPPPRLETGAETNALTPGLEIRSASPRDVTWRSPAVEMVPPANHSNRGGVADRSRQAARELGCGRGDAIGSAIDMPATNDTKRKATRKTVAPRRDTAELTDDRLKFTSPPVDRSTPESRVAPRKLGSP